MIDYAEILARKYPNTQWELIGSDYEGLSWKSETPKPTKIELEDLWNLVLEEIESEKKQLQAKKVAALAKLEALGLDEDDLKALGI